MKIFLTRLSKIEEQVLQLSNNLEKLKSQGITSVEWVPQEQLSLHIALVESQINTLNLQRQYIIDKRGNLFWKTIWNTIWNIIIPICVSFLTALLYIKFLKGL